MLGYDARVETFKLQTPDSRTFNLTIFQTFNRSFNPIARPRPSHGTLRGFKLSSWIPVQTLKLQTRACLQSRNFNTFQLETFCFLVRDPSSSSINPTRDTCQALHAIHLANGEHFLAAKLSTPVASRSQILERNFQPRNLRMFDPSNYRTFNLLDGRPSSFKTLELATSNILSTPSFQSLSADRTRLRLAFGD